MRILLHSHLFAPSVGGVEQVAFILAGEFQRSGHEVQVCTSTPPGAGVEGSFPIVRRPSAAALRRLVRWSQLVFHNNISLQAAWPLLGCLRPWVIAHHTWIRRPQGGLGWQDRLKRSVLRFATNIAVSQAIAASLPVPSTVIENPYQEDIFRVDERQPRSRDLIFVGRLVSDKGADLLLEALARLHGRNLRPNLTVVGLGPELDKLKSQAAGSGLQGQITFAGLKVGNDLAALLNQHRILVAPSRWQEPFGIVALEAIACGCAVIGSAGGGLPEAIGPCGLTFPNHDAPALAARLAELLESGEKIAALRAAAPTHLERHRPPVVAARYLQVFANAL